MPVVQEMPRSGFAILLDHIRSAHGPIAIHLDHFIADELWCRYFVVGPAHQTFFSCFVPEPVLENIAPITEGTVQNLTDLQVPIVQEHHGDIVNIGNGISEKIPVEISRDRNYVAANGADVMGEESETLNARSIEVGNTQVIDLPPVFNEPASNIPDICAWTEYLQD